MNFQYTHISESILYKENGKTISETEGVFIILLKNFCYIISFYESYLISEAF